VPAEARKNFLWKSDLVGGCEKAFAERGPAKALMVLEMRSGRGRRDWLTGSLAAVVHGLHLLKLVGGEDRGELALRFLVDGVELLLAILRGEVGVCHERGNLLLAVGEDGLELGGLIGAEVQLFAEHQGGTMGVAGVLAAVTADALDGGRGLLGGGGGLLGECNAAGESEKQSCGEEDGFHVVLLAAARGRNSLRAMGLNTSGKECCAETGPVVCFEGVRVYREAMTVTVEIPDIVAGDIVPEGIDAARKILEDAVAQAYREGKLTTYQVQMALGLPTRMHVDPFLLKYEIYDYTVEMLEKDLKTLESLELQAR